MAIVQRALLVEAPVSVTSDHFRAEDVAREAANWAALAGHHGEEQSFSLRESRPGERLELAGGEGGASVTLTFAALQGPATWVVCVVDMPKAAASDGAAEAVSLVRRRMGEYLSRVAEEAERAAQKGYS